MNFDNAEGMVFRPPSEANSLILRITIGCSHNACTFCAMYKNTPFQIRHIAEIKALIARAQTLYPTARRVFLADGNALALPTKTLLIILNLLHEAFPRLTRVGCYAGPRDINAKSPEELKALRDAGLKIAYMGIESGDPEILQQVRKGVTPEQLIIAGQKLLHAGIKLSATIILGLGGKERTTEHALNTASMINAIQPTMLGALTLMVYPGTALATDISSGIHTPLTTREILDEHYRILKAIDVVKPCIYRSDHASNYLPLAGTLPKDKNILLNSLQQIISNNRIPTHYNYKE